MRPTMRDKKTGQEENTVPRKRVDGRTALMLPPLLWQLVFFALPLAFLLRRTWFYRRLLTGGSVVIALVAVVLLVKIVLGLLGGLFGP